MGNKEVREKRCEERMQKMLEDAKKKNLQK